MNWSKKISAYESVLAVVLLLLLLQYFFPRPYLIPLVIGVVLLALLSHSFAEILHQGWQKLTQAIGWVMSKFLLSLVFFAFLTPLALLYRFFQKKKKPSDTSNFVDRDHLFQADDLTHPW